VIDGKGILFDGIAYDGHYRWDMVGVEADLYSGDAAVS
jgi:hypothetical protein